jgi:predicted alternative tryptophan synthase beta-subunit
MYTLGHSFVPAPEPAHAVRVAIDEALRCKEAGESKVIAINLCGHGHFDMQAYTDYFAGNLVTEHYDESEVAMALAGLPAVA